MRNDRHRMYHRVLVLLALLPAVPAGAESPAEALTRIEAETMLLKARERQLDAQASVLNKQNEIALRQSISAALPRLHTGSDPVLRGIEGIGSALFATLETIEGVFEVRHGDVLPNGLRVAAISENGVTLRNDAGRTVHLVVSLPNRAIVHEEQTAAAGNTGAVPSLPPLPLPTQRRSAR